MIHRHQTVARLFRGLVLLTAFLSANLHWQALAVPAVGQSPAPQSELVYTEAFTTYAAKDLADQSVWDIWAGALRLARHDAVPQYTPTVAIDSSGNAIVVWHDNRNGDYDVYAQKVDGAGNRLWAADVRVNGDTGTASQINPVVCVDGSDSVFIVWRDSRSGDDDIYAQKLNSAGSRQWSSDRRVNSDTGTASQSYATVSGDESGNAIVVWQDGRNGNDDIYAQKLNSAGSRQWSPDRRVNGDAGTARQIDPAVSVDASGSAIVAWQDDRNGNPDIYAQQISSSGSRQWSVDLRVNTDTGTASQTIPKVSTGGGSSAVVIWVDLRRGNEDVYAQRINGTGSRLWSSERRVNNDTGTESQSYPAVAAQQDGSVFVVWRDFRNRVRELNRDVYGQKLDGAGNRLWSADLKVNGDTDIADQYDPTVAVDGNGNAIVTWADYRYDTADIYAQKLSGTGSRLWVPDLRINEDAGTAAQWYSTIAVDKDANAIAVWSDSRNGNNDIYAQKLDGAGNLLWGIDLQVNSGSRMGHQWYPDTAVGSDGDIIVAWYDNRTGSWDIYAQRLDADGNRLWFSDLRVNTDTGTAEQYPPAVAVDGNGNAIVVWEDWRNGNADIYAQKINRSGEHLWAADVRVNRDTGSAGQWFPDVTVDENGNAVVAWQDGRNGNNDIYAQRLGATGNRLWASDLRVNTDTGTSYQYVPAIAVDDGQNVVIAWCDWRSGTRDIYAQRVSAAKVLLWSSDVRVNSDAGTADQLYLDVATDANRNAIVVWQDNRGGNYDIYAQKLGPAGNRMWAADARTNSDTGIESQERPVVAVDGGGNAVVAWIDTRNGDWDTYIQKLNQVGNRAWLADLQVSYPDLYYYLGGTAQSCTVDTIGDNISQANLTADVQLNGGEVQFLLTNDGGAHWAPVIPGVTHVFTTAGSDLRWQARLSGDPRWRHRTPLVSNLRIGYSAIVPYNDDYEADDTCAQARPAAVSGSAQTHTFHQQADQDWVWFDAVAGATYILQTTHTGSQVDTVLELFNACDQPPADSDDNAFSTGSVIAFQPLVSGRYYLKVSQHDPAIYGESTDYQLAVRAQSLGGAAIIVAGRLRTDDYVQPIISATANLVYQTFLQKGFSPDRILYLNADLTQPGVDGSPGKDSVREAIQTWARSRVALGAPLWLYMADHGDVDRFNNQVGEVVTAAELDLWLDNLEATTGVDQVNVIIDACFSGSFIDTHQSGMYGADEISGNGRVVVTSTTSHWWAYAPFIEPGQPLPLMYFSGGFWNALDQGQDIWSAFLAGRETVVGGMVGGCGDYDYDCQCPWLDDTGDAWFDDQDGQVARGRGLASVFASSIVPYIDWAEVGPATNGKAALRAQVRDDGSVVRVWARIFAPSFTLPTSTDGSIPMIEVPEVDLDSAGSNTFTATYSGFVEQGDYRVVVYALDDEGNVSMPFWAGAGEEPGENKIYLPLVNKN